jgi:hypothetical protein
MLIGLGLEQIDLKLDKIGKSSRFKRNQKRREKDKSILWFLNWAVCAWNR